MRHSCLPVGNHSSSLFHIVGSLKFGRPPADPLRAPSVWSQTSAPSDLSAEVFRSKPLATHSAHTHDRSHTRDTVCVCVYLFFVYMWGPKLTFVTHNVGSNILCGDKILDPTTLTLNFRVKTEVYK